jgi:hypothetical protein
VKLACTRCRNYHFGYLVMPNKGWMLLFATDWEESCDENALEYQGFNQAPITGYSTTSTKRFFEFAN